MPRFALLLLILCLPLIVGCEGCRNSGESENDDQQDKQAALQDFSAKMPSVFPADINPISGGIKPGHWLTASQPLKSNKVDLRGELLSSVSVTGENFQSGAAQTIEGPIPSLRPAVLPKGQLRRFNYRTLAPIPPSSDEKKSYLNSRFLSRGRSVLYDTGRQPFNVLAAQEFFFVILTNRPERFAKFQVADWVRPPRDQYEFQDQLTNYRIVIPPVDELLPLSDTMLDWTATAVLFWDDLSPDALTPDQQTAIADWIRFGGQLIVNGADAADAIANTPLSDTLPLKPTGNIELDPDAATELLRGHSVSSDKSTEKQISLVKDQTARLAVDGIAATDATAVADTGELILERLVGRGRVVQSRFDVTADWLSNWLSYDSFVNSALLRRPRRRYIVPYEESPLQQTYPARARGQRDPTLNTRFRIAARDAILPNTIAEEPLRLSTTESQDAESTVTPTEPAGRASKLTRNDSASGISGWSDDSDVISICRQILREEAGIEIPDSSLVVRSLGYYLLILVPINYLFFRLLGRLEYAWLAVPLIAIGGAAWVARAARLDIGFARSQTEVALVELQPRYRRGHVSRVVAIYNSLSSAYEIESATIDSVAAPIGNQLDSNADIVLRTGFTEGPVLAGFAVGSNQVRLLHCEQIIDMGGTIELTDDGRLINQTSHELLDTFVIEKSAAGEVKISSVGSCQSGSTVNLRPKNAAAISLADDLPMQTARLIRRLASPSAMPNGTSRLLGRIDQALAGITIKPQANQTLSQTIVLAHLRHQPVPDPEVDDNLVSDFVAVLTDESEQSAQPDPPGQPADPGAEATDTSVEAIE